MPQNKKPKKAARAAKRGVKRISGAEKRAKDLAKRKKSLDRQERLTASKAKKRGVKRMPQEGPGQIKQKVGKQLVVKKKQVVRKTKSAVKGPAKKGVTKVSSPKPKASTLSVRATTREAGGRIAKSKITRKTRVKKQSGPTPRKIKEKVTKRGRKRKVKY